MEDHIIITESDYTRLCNLVNAEKSSKTTELKHLSVLGAEIKRAKRIDPRKISPDFVTMNSQIEVTDMDTKKPILNRGRYLFFHRLEVLCLVIKQAASFPLISPRVRRRCGSKAFCISRRLTENTISERFNDGMKILYQSC